MKVTTWNVNGIRAREAQVLEWVLTHRPDVVCLQEIKASPDAVPQSLCELVDYWCFWHGHKGYSGVAITLRKETFPEEPAFFHPPFDDENRVVAVRLGKLVVASVYVPNGGKDFPAKLRFLEGLDAFVRAELADGADLLVCGDLNVALEDSRRAPGHEEAGAGRHDRGGAALDAAHPRRGDGGPAPPLRPRQRSALLVVGTVEELP